VALSSSGPLDDFVQIRWGLRFMRNPQKRDAVSFCKKIGFPRLDSADRTGMCTCTLEATGCPD
jgi:hypothetical protein